MHPVCNLMHGHCVSACVQLPCPEPLPNRRPAGMHDELPGVSNSTKAAAGTLLAEG